MATTTTSNTVTFANTTRSDTGNTGYDAVFIDRDDDYAAWFLKTEEYTDQTYTVTLDGVDYDIRLRWNTRDEAWQVFFGLSGEDPVATFKATNGLDLLAPYKYLEAVPDGQLYMIDTVKINGRPGYYDTGLDKRYCLVYVDALTSQS